MIFLLLLQSFALTTIRVGKDTFSPSFNLNLITPRSKIAIDIERSKIDKEIDKFKTLLTNAIKRNADKSQIENINKLISKKL